MAGRNLSDLLEHLRAKPVHHRRSIALGTSVGVTALVAVAWVVAMSTSGAFSLKTTAIVASAGDTAGTVQDAVQSTKSNFSQLVGAAGAAIGASSFPAALTIVETRASSTLDTKPVNETDQTVIPF